MVLFPRLVSHTTRFMCPPAQMAVPTTPTTISDIPEPCLISILQQLSLQDRLTSCSLVSTAWAAAARLATTDITTEVTPQRWGYSLAAWLEKCSLEPDLHALTCLELHRLAESTDSQNTGNRRYTAYDDNLTVSSSGTLCYPELQRLVVQDCTVTEGFSCWQEQCRISALISLTYLALDLSNIGSQGSFSLARLTNLQHLSLHPPTAGSYATGTLCNGPLDLVEKVRFNTTSSLAKLQHLTHLCLGCNDSSESDPADVVWPHPWHNTARGPTYDRGHLDRHLSHLSALTALQQLQLGLPMTAAALEGLTALSGLTWLLLDNTRRMNLSSSMPGFAQFSALQRLQLRKPGWLDPSVLSSMQQLRYLELTDVSTKIGSEERHAVLLAAIPLMQQLTYLRWAGASPAMATPLAAYSALTASSKLQQLHLSGVDRRLQAHHIFTTTSQQTQLLAFSWLGSPPLELHTLSDIAAACPRLRQLAVRFAVQHPLTDDSLSVLQQLPELTRLFLHAADSSNNSAGVVRLVAGLTGLRDLDLSLWDQPVMSDLESLTQLGGLTRLSYKDIKRQHTVLTNKVSLIPAFQELQHTSVFHHALHGNNNVMLFHVFYKPSSCTEPLCT